MTDRVNEELLERLRKKCGCVYMSDLIDGKHTAQIKEQLTEIPASDYGLKEWVAAANYLTHRSCDGLCDDEVRLLIIKCMQPFVVAYKIKPPQLFVIKQLRGFVVEIIQPK